MSIEALTIIMILSLVMTLALGLPLSFTLGGIATIFTIGIWGAKGLLMPASTAFSLGTNDVLISIPLFIFMGTMLQFSGIADDLYETMHSILGSVRGGLSSGTVFVCTFFAAMAGISAVATVTMGLIALPAMLNRGYDKSLALGCIAGGGALGILIPPSVIMIIYALLAGQSVGKLFAAGITPGLMLATLFISYITIRSYLQPKIAPLLPLEERLSLKGKLVALKAIIYPTILIFLVLGTIYLGIATPTEAAGIGALGSVIVVILQRKFTLKIFRDACKSAFRLSAMSLWIVIGSGCFAAIYNAAGSQELVTQIIAGLPGGRWAVFAVIHATYFILGTFLDPTGIVLLCTPIFVPVITKLGFDAVWFGITFVINMEMAYLTPPFGFNLFYLKSIVPEGITMVDIYKAVIPFIIIQFICLILVSVFPGLVMWLPNLLKY